MISPDPIDDIDAQLPGQFQKFSCILFIYDAYLLIYSFPPKPRATFNVVGCFGPILAQGMAKRINATFVMSLSLWDREAAHPQCNDAKL